MKLKSIGQFLVAFVAVILASPLRAAPAPLFEDPVVAKAKGGLTVKLSEVEDEFLSYKASVAATGRPLPNDQREEFLKKILDRVVTTKLVMQHATAEDRAKAEEKMKAFMAESARRAGSEEALKRQIESSGLSHDQWSAKLLERITVDEVFIREVKGKIEIPDEQIRAYYHANPERFKQKDSYKILYLLKLTIEPKSIGTPGGPIPLTDLQKQAKREEIEKILTRLKAGEEFGALAREFSEDSGSRDKGGEITFQKGQLLPDLETAIMKLPLNQLSDVITNAMGYQIVKVLEATPEHIVDLAKVQDRLKDYLAAQESDRRAPEYIEKLKKEGELEILDPKLKP